MGALDHHTLSYIRGSQKILKEGLGFPRRGGGQIVVSQLHAHGKGTPHIPSAVMSSTPSNSQDYPAGRAQASPLISGNPRA